MDSLEYCGVLSVCPIPAQGSVNSLPLIGRAVLQHGNMAASLAWGMMAQCFDLPLEVYPGRLRHFSQDTVNP
jgi:hypothetical protein